MKSYVIIYLLKIGVFCMDVFVLEQLRKKAILKFLLSILLDSVLVALFLHSVFNLYLSDMVGKVLTFGFILYLIFSIIFKGSIEKNFEKTVKKNCIQKILDDIVADNGKVEWKECAFLDYSENDMLPGKYSGIMMPDSGYSDNKSYDNGATVENDVSANKTLQLRFNPRESRLFDFSSVATDDSFEGIYKGINFKIIETEFISRSGKHRSTVFKGSWMIIKSNKQFNSHTIISKRNYFLQNDLFKLDIPIPDFKKKYKVYTNSLQETSSVMSSDLCNLLTGMKNKTSMAIYDSNIILAIQMHGDLFKLGSIFKRVDDSKQYTKFVQEISSLLSIIGRLKSIENLGLEQVEPVETI